LRFFVFLFIFSAQDEAGPCQDRPGESGGDRLLYDASDVHEAALAQPAWPPHQLEVQPAQHQGPDCPPRTSATRHEAAGATAARGYLVRDASKNKAIFLSTVPCVRVCQLEEDVRRRTIK
jgi:hypothetical protein